MDLLKYIMINLKNKSIVLVTSYLELSITFDCKIKDQLEEWIANDKMLKITLHELEKEDFKKIMKSKFGYSQNHQNLINFLYDITGGNLLKLNYEIKEVKLNKANKNKVNLILSEDVKVTVKKGENNKTYTYDIKLNTINYPIKKGEKIGKLYLKDGNKILREISLVSDSNIKKASIFKQYLRVVENYFTGSVN